MKDLMNFRKTMKNLIQITFNNTLFRIFPQTIFK